jgi:tetratricopeptide (TPR) repeat protein
VATTKDKLIAGAQKLVEKGQFEKAIKEYLKVVQQDDKDVRIWLKIGDLYAKIGRKTEASETYQRVAQFYSDQGFYLKSVAVYKQILKIDPRLVEVNQRLAELYKQLGLLSDAMMQYETVAAFYHREGKTREALAALKQIVELDPETVANRIKLAELYSKEAMAREAIDEFSKAAEQLREAGRTDDFMKVAERLLFHSPDNRPISKELARLYIEKGDPRRALPKLQVCFKADPRDLEVLTLLAAAFEALDQRSKAVSVLKELARILGENGDAAGRVEVYRKIIDLEPGDLEADAVLSGVRRSSPLLSSQPPAAEEPRASASSPWEGRRQNDEMPPSAVHEFDDPRSNPRIAATRPSSNPRIEELDDDDLHSAPQPITNTAVGQLLEGDQPPRRADDEELQRILNETDVYIKYKLYAKAIEHVQRVFESDPRHLEAREKLKALYLTVGKKEEAVLELWSLAEQAEPGRQRRYLREIIELDPANVRAAGLLGVEPAEADESRPVTYDGDPDDIEELAEDEFAVADPSGVIRAPSLEEDDLIPVVVEPMREGGAVADGSDDDSFGLDVPTANVEDRFGFGDQPAPPEPRDEELVPMPPSHSEELAVEAGIAAVDQLEPPSNEPPRSEPPRDEMVPQRGPQPPRPRFRSEDSTGDHDLHTRFDDQAIKFIEQQALFEVDESELPPVAGLSSPQTATTRAPALTDDEPRPSTSEMSPVKEPSVDPITATATPIRPAPPERPETSLEDDLDEADFFVQQNLFEEARGILQLLLARLPSHPLVTAKLRDLESMERAVVGGGLPPPEPIPEGEIEEGSQVRAADLSAELPADLPGQTDAGAAVGDATAEPVEMTRKGVIEKGVTAEDFETHYDLGIAYKEMGLLDDAISEFKLVMKDPTREVQCHLMIGLCCLEKGMQTEAIGHFKKGLYVEGITERESLSLYFELGQAYERLNDPREALYYYEKVVKRDPRFRNVEKHIEALRTGAEASAPHAPKAGADDVDAAFDGLLGDDR